MSPFEKSLLWVSATVMVLLMVLIVYSENGLRDWMELRKEEVMIRKATQEIKAQNLELARRIERLKQDLDYIEHVARHDLEMVKQDELIFKFRGEGNDSSSIQQP